MEENKLETDKQLNDPSTNIFNLELPNDLDEEISFRPSIVAELPLCLLIVIVFVICVMATINYPRSVEWVELFRIGQNRAILPIPLYFLPPIVLAFLLIHRLYDSKYVIGKDYIRALHGLLSFKKQDIRLEYMDIRGIEINRGLYGRVVNTGVLTIGTAMMEKEEMNIKDIYNPSFYRDIILKRRDIVNSKYIMRHD